MFVFLLLPVSQVSMGRSFLLMHTGVAIAAGVLSTRVASYSSHIISFNIYKRFRFSFRFFGRSISPQKALNCNTDVQVGETN